MEHAVQASARPSKEVVSNFSAPEISSVAEGDAIIAAVEGGGTSFRVSIARCLKPKPRATNNDDNKAVIPHRFVEDMEEILTEEFPTNEDPSKTIDAICAYLRSHRPPAGNGRVAGFSGVGITCFGPLGVDPDDTRNEGKYGTILSGSPKTQWRGVDIVTPLLRACAGDGDAVPLPPHKLDTDVNAPAMAEFWHLEQEQKSNKPDVNKRITSLAYVTVGTGVGVGLVLNSKPVHGMMHPEGGHVCVSPLPGDDFPGYSWGSKSPYGGRHTVEGIASSVALVERLRWTEEKGHKASDIHKRREAGPKLDITEDLGSGGVVVVEDNDVVHVVSTSCSESGQVMPTLPDGTVSESYENNLHDRDVLKNLPDDHFLWEHAANALANLCVSLVLLLSIERIVLGGGIMRRKCLFEKVRRRTIELLNGYVDTKELRRIEDYILESTWGDRAGIVGALILGKLAYEEKGGIYRRDLCLVDSECSDAGLVKATATDHYSEKGTSSPFWRGFGTGFAIASLLFIITGSRGHAFNR